MKHPLLHSLAFGSQIAKTERSALALQERMAATQGWDSRYDVVGPAGLFVTQSAALQLNGLRLTAVTHSPFQSKVIANTITTIVVPLAGEATRSQINGKSISMIPGESAAFAPAGERVGSGKYRSVLMIDIDAQRLQSTWAAMYGNVTTSHGQLDLSNPQELSLRSVGPALHHLCAIVDQFCMAPDTLVSLGIDESFYRFAAMLMAPNKAAIIEDGNQPYLMTRRRVDAACQYVMAHLNQTITLSDLERVANLSSRSLQYAFLQRFNCTPMQWVRDQRLIAVQRCLAKAGPDATVSSIALAFGFSSLSKFAAGYAKRFGELPSVTLSKSAQR